MRLQRERAVGRACGLADFAAGLAPRRRFAHVCPAGRRRRPAGDTRDRAGRRVRRRTALRGAPHAPLGAAFGVLIALTLAGEAGYLKSAQDIVAGEAAAASRLAWAATSPGVRSDPIHEALLEYLEATRAAEWRGAGSEGGDAGVARAIASLEQVVRAEAARTELGTPASTELLASLDAVTAGRRERVAAASREIPVLYIVTLLVGGVALIANAGALGLRSSVRASLLVVGLAVVVGLSLALLFSLSRAMAGTADRQRSRDRRRRPRPAKRLLR